MALAAAAAVALVAAPVADGDGATEASSVSLLARKEPVGSARSSSRLPRKGQCRSLTDDANCADGTAGARARPCRGHSRRSRALTLMAVVNSSSSSSKQNIMMGARMERHGGTMAERCFQDL